MYKQLVLAIFPSETAADRAAAELKGWEKANDEIKSGAIGVLVKDNDGKIKAHKLGTRETTRGAGVGLVLGIIATVLSGGLALLAGVVGGIIVGGIVGSFVHRGLGMSDEDFGFSVDISMPGGPPSECSSPRMRPQRRALS